MALTTLKVEPGISSASVKNIPTAWDAAWFRRFISNFLMGGDVRNAIAGPGITITGNLASPFATISAGAGSGVSQIIAGTNISITPAGGTGAVTVNSTGGGSLTKIAETVLSAPGASVTFSAIPATYRNLVLYLTYAASVNTAPSLLLNFNGDTSADYYAQLLYGFNTSTAASSTLGQTAMTFISPTPINSLAGAAAGLTFRIPNYAGTVFDKNVLGEFLRPDSASELVAGTASGVWANTAAISSIQIALSSGNFVTGSTFSLYGES